MTDKEKFRKEVEKLKSNLIYGACSSQVAMETMCKEEAYNEVLAILDSLQEEPVSKVWHYQKKEPVNEIVDKSRPIIVVYGNNSLNVAGKFRYYEDNSDAIWLSNSYEKWAFVEDLINLTHSVTKVSWQEEPVSEDLEEAVKRNRAMSKAEEFIIEYTKNCCNAFADVNYAKDIKPKGVLEKVYQPWLTPDQARRAVEIAREEIYEWLNENFFNYFEARMSMFENCLEDLKQAMKDE